MNIHAPIDYTALKVFAAFVEEQPDTPCLTDMDLPSQSLLHGKSIRPTQGVLVSKTLTALINVLSYYVDKSFNKFLAPYPDEDDFQNLISSFLSKERQKVVTMTWSVALTWSCQQVARQADGQMPGKKK